MIAPFGFAVNNPANEAILEQTVIPFSMIVYPNKSWSDDGAWEARIQAADNEKGLLEGNVALIRIGAKVVDKNEVVLGQISWLQTDDNGKLTGLVISSGLAFTKDLTIEADWLDSISESLISLKYSRAEIMGKLSHKLKTN